MKEKELVRAEEAESAEKTAAEPAEEKAPETGAERDFAREIRELIEKYPELSGRSLSDEVVMAAVGGMSLIEAYEAYKDHTLQAEKNRLEKEQRVERQNEQAAVRAPVRGVSGGAAVKTHGEDDFLRGFNAGY